MDDQAIRYVMGGVDSLMLTMMLAGNRVRLPANIIRSDRSLKTQSSTTVPFGTTVMPSGVTVNPRARSCSVSMPTVEFSVSTTFLSRIAL